MKKILGILTVLMFLLSGVAYAQEAEAITATTTEDTAEPVVTAAETTTEEPVPTLYTETPVDAEALADDSAITAEVSSPEAETTSEEAVVIEGGEEYGTVDQFMDRIRLAFTFQEERKVELMNRISERREAHYEFLVAKGKTEQAEKFKGKTIGLVKNFDQWKANRAEKLDKIENKVVNAKNPEKAGEKVAERVEKKVQEKAKAYDDKAAEVDEELTERENSIEERTQTRTKVKAGSEETETENETS